MRRKFLLASSALSIATLGGLTGAMASPTLVATIYGAYDSTNCFGNASSCFSGTLATNHATNGGQSYDTPSLWINNTTGFSFSNVQFTLTAYQGINKGSVTVIPSGTIAGNTIAANTLYALLWSAFGAGTGHAVPGSGSNTSANLFTYDYDDYYGGNSGAPACFASGGQGGGFCQTPGNFDVTMTATWDNGGAGTPIFAQFSPDNTQDGGNAAGAFVGWEGLDPTGLAETSYDNHISTVTGVLADIYVGTPPPPPVPEPATLALLGAGLGALALIRRRRRS